MATRTALELHQGNSEVLEITITPDDVAEDLTAVTRLACYIKASPCVADSDSTTIALTTDDPTQVLITVQTAAQIVATVTIPYTSLAEPYYRWWHIEAFVGTTRRTAMYGPVTVVDL